MLTQLILISVNIDFMSVHIDFIFHQCRGLGQPIEFHLDNKVLPFFHVSVGTGQSVFWIVDVACCFCTVCF